MATTLPLPKHADLPSLVIFHRDHPAEPRLLMQMPTNEDRSEFATYVLRLDNPEHKGWFDRLRSSRDLLELLGYEMHVAFCPETGYMREMEDIDAPSYPQLAVAYGRLTAQMQEPIFDRVVSKRRSIERAAPYPISQLRAHLRGHGGVTVAPFARIR